MPVFHQHPLRIQPPPTWVWQRTITRILTFEEGPGGRLAFTYKHGVLDEIDDDDPITKVLNILVDKHAEVIIELDENKAWRWSHRYDAITTKKDYTNLYGELWYWHPVDMQYVPRPGDVLPFDCRKIRFKVRDNEDYSHQDDIQGFSLNIELLQPNGKYLPITVDPDIKNPPTGQTLERLKNDINAVVEEERYLAAD